MIAILVAIPLDKVAGGDYGQADGEPPPTSSAAYQVYLPQITKEPDERFALMALFHSTAGDDWTDHTGWNTSAPYCTWFGVTCDIDDRVISLSLVDNNLSGQIPPEIGLLSDLTVLNLWGNQTCNIWCWNGLYGPIPPEIGYLVNLQVLSLSSNYLDTIPPEIENLVNLRVLFLGRNNLLGSIPLEIGKLVELRELDLSYNKLSGPIPVEVSQLVNLERIDLSTNLLSGNIIPEIGNMTNLQVLRLSDNQFSGEIPAKLSNLRNLGTFMLISNSGFLCWETQAALDWALVLPFYMGPTNVCSKKS